MKKFFSLDSPFICFMENVADFFILNLLTVVCSIPLVTIGAALTAHHRVMQDKVLDWDQPIMKTYFRAFAENFVQATVFWLMTAVVIALFAVDIFVIHVYFDEGWAQMTYMLLAVLGFIAFGIACYAFPLIARYENTMKEHFRNSFILALGNLPRTLLLVLLAGIPVFVAVVSIELFFNTVFIWLVFGISVILFLQTLVLKPIILRLEQKDTDDGQ